TLVSMASPGGKEKVGLSRLWPPWLPPRHQPERDRLHYIRSVPGRFGQDRLGRPILVGRRDGNEMAVLPLAAEPEIAQLVVLKSGLAQHGIERAGREFVRHRLADETYPRKGFLEHLQTGIGDDASPPVRLGADEVGMALTIIHHLLIVDVDAAKAHDAFGILAILLVERGEARPHPEIKHLRIELGHLRLLG